MVKIPISNFLFKNLKLFLLNFHNSYFFLLFFKSKLKKRGQVSNALLYSMVTTNVLNLKPMIGITILNGDDDLLSS